MSKNTYSLKTFSKQLSQFKFFVVVYVIVQVGGPQFYWFLLRLDKIENTIRDLAALKDYSNLIVAI